MKKNNGKVLYYSSNLLGGEYTPKRIEGIVSVIKDDKELAAQTRKIRALVTDSEEQVMAKEELPLITCMVFEDGTSSSDVVSRLGFIFDYDHLSKKELKVLRKKLESDSLSYLVAESARGEGLYQVILLTHHETNGDIYAREYEKLRIKLWDKYGVEPDPSATNSKQVRFIAHDDNPYFNLKCKKHKKYDSSPFVKRKASYNEDGDYSDTFVDPYKVQEYFLEEEWKEVKSRSKDYIYLTRPGKEGGVSGSIELESGWFTCFSSTPEQFRKHTHKKMPPEMAIGLLKYHGEYYLAKKALGLVKSANEGIKKSKEKLKKETPKSDVFESVINWIDSNEISIPDMELAMYFAKWSDGKIFCDVLSNKHYVFDGKCFVKDEKDNRIRKIFYDFIDELSNYAIGVNVNSNTLNHIYRYKNLTKAKSVADAVKMYTMVEKFDEDDHLFNVQNGILNLETGELLPHSTKYRITKIANAEYHPELCEVSGEAREILLSFFMEDEGILNFMFEFLGASLSGFAGIRKFIYAFGTGRNGKSTLFNYIIDHIFNTYATTTNFQTFTGYRDAGNASSDVVRLLDMRLVVANEANPDQKINIGLLKSITGGDPVNGRYLFENESKHKPRCSLVFFGNNQLKLDNDSSDGMVDRYAQIPFKNKFGKGNSRSIKEIYKILDDNKSQILNSMIEGYKRYSKSGFSEVDIIKEESLKGFEGLSIAKDFIKTTLEKTDNKDDVVSIKDFYDSYKELVEELDIPSQQIFKRKDLIEKLKAQKFEVKQVNRRDSIIKVKLRKEN